MVRLGLILAMFLLVTLGPAMGNSMDAYRWSNRVVLIFAPKSDQRLSRQRDLLLADQAGLQDRDMVVLTVSGDRVETVFGPSAAETAEALRADFNVPAEALVILLLGKDGGVKLWETQMVEPDALFGLIDSMPMRQTEMREP